MIELFSGMPDALYMFQGEHNMNQDLRDYLEYVESCRRQFVEEMKRPEAFFRRRDLHRQLMDAYSNLPVGNLLTVLKEIERKVA